MSLPSLAALAARPAVAPLAVGPTADRKKALRDGGDGDAGAPTFPLEELPMELQEKIFDMFKGLLDSNSPCDRVMEIIAKAKIIEPSRRTSKKVSNDDWWHLACTAKQRLCVKHESWNYSCAPIHV